MSSISNGLPYRLFWAIFGIALSAFAFEGFVKSGGYSNAITSVGWALLAVGWFLQPVKLSFKMSEMIQSSFEYAVGPLVLRAFAILGGILCLNIGLVLKFVART